MNIEKWEIKQSLIAYKEQKKIIDEICEFIETGSNKLLFDMSQEFLRFVETYAKSYYKAFNHRMIVLKELGKTNEINLLQQEKIVYKTKIQKAKEKLNNLNFGCSQEQ